MQLQKVVSLTLLIALVGTACGEKSSKKADPTVPGNNSGMAADPADRAKSASLLIKDLRKEFNIAPRNTNLGSNLRAEAYQSMSSANFADETVVDGTDGDETDSLDTKPSTGKKTPSEKNNHGIFQEEGEHSCDEALNMFDSLFDSLEKGALSHLEKITAEKDKNKLPDLVLAYIESSSDSFGEAADDDSSVESEDEEDDSFENASDSVDFELAIATPTTPALVKIKPKNGPDNNYIQFQANNSDTGLAASFELRQEVSDGLVDQKLKMTNKLAANLTNRLVKIDFELDSFNKFNPAISGLPGFDEADKDSADMKETEVRMKSKMTMEVGAGENKPYVRQTMTAEAPAQDEDNKPVVFGYSLLVEKTSANELTVAYEFSEGENSMKTSSKLFIGNDKTCKLQVGESKKAGSEPAKK